jgi:hypothetical protein
MVGWWWAEDLYKYFACIRASAGQPMTESDARSMKQPWFNLLVSSLAFGVGDLGVKRDSVRGWGTWFVLGFDDVR